ncbi:DUF3780 domain-containing protein [Sphingomonas aracearum]|nr:DUF3780 domain-containing protein [Sphingomonas aracearum]
MASKSIATIGYGVPTSEMDPQRFVVQIPQNAREPVVLVEDFGLAGPQYDANTNTRSDRVVRCRLDQKRWRQIATPLKTAFNERLRSRKMAAGKWTTGDNPVHRLLGREMCVLAWAIESCDADLVSSAIDAWIGLRPEERWWLYSMAVHATGRAEDIDKGWRKAIRIGLTEGAGAVDADNKRQISFEDL